jgi:hypothetical protein
MAWVGDNYVVSVPALQYVNRPITKTEMKQWCGRTAPFRREVVRVLLEVESDLCKERFSFFKVNRRELEIFVSFGQPLLLLPCDCRTTPPSLIMVLLLFL